MKANLLSPDIYEIEDFVSIEEQSEILNYCNSLDESKWWSSDSTMSDFFNGKSSIEKTPKIFENIDKKIKNLFFDFHNINSLTLLRHLDSHFMLPHVDWSQEYFKSTDTYNDPYIRYGLILYYNDDYVGGALNYPNLGIVHKPKARSLLIHGGHILHGTTKVFGPTRYFSTTFVFGTKINRVKLNKNVFKNVEQSDGYEYA
jgi:hypothetical protein